MWFGYAMRCVELHDLSGSTQSRCPLPMDIRIHEASRSMYSLLKLLPVRSYHVRSCRAWRSAPWYESYVHFYMSAHRHHQISHTPAERDCAREWRNGT
jgi:hypothetical protein